MAKPPPLHSKFSLKIESSEMHGACFYEINEMRRRAGAGRVPGTGRMGLFFLWAHYHPQSLGACPLIGLWVEHNQKCTVVLPGLGRLFTAC